MTSKQFPSLKNAPVNFKLLREKGKKRLDEMLKVYESDKTVVLDPNLTRPLNLITEGVNVFTSNRVKEFAELSWEKLRASHQTVIFITRPEIPLMKQIIQHVRRASEDGSDQDFVVFFVPRRTFICSQILKDEQADATMIDLEVEDFDLDLIPFEDDILSLELFSSFSDCFIDNDTMMLSHVARSIMKLQSLYGVIPHLKAKGRMASTVLNMVLRMRDERFAAGVTDFSHASEIDTCCIIDRSVDLVSPLVTPLTYEALIDEILGIENGVLKVSSETLGGDRAKSGGDPDLSSKSSDDAATATKTKSLFLNNNSSLFQEIRDVNISALGAVLEEKSREIRALYNSRPDAENFKSKSVDALREFVRKIPALKEGYESLEAHTQIAEEIVRTTNSVPFRKRWKIERAILEGGSGQSYVRDAIARQEPLVDVLRLMCLQSIVGSGLKDCDYLRTEILQTYGYECLLTLHRLEKLQMITKRSGPLHWPSVRKNFKLINGEVNADSPNDIAYVTSGYAPLSARVVQMAMKNEWKRNENLLRLLPGPHLECTQPGVATSQKDSRRGANITKGSSSKAAAKARRDADEGRKKTLLVYFVGGITFMEIAALRWLSRQKGSRYNIVIATTKMISGRTFIQSIVEGLPNALAPS